MLAPTIGCRAPSETEVVVAFCAVPSRDAAVVRRALPLLSDEERERAARFRFEGDRASFCCAHLLLRRCLDGATGRTDWSLARNPHGKPALHPASGWPALAFNISHTRGWVACALARGHEVGVDAEAFGASVDPLDLGEVHFSPGERRLLQDCTPDRLQKVFLNIWTMKEAVVKAMGVGLQLPLSQFTVEVERPAVRFDPVLAEDEARWYLDCLRTDTAWLAVAVRSPSGVPVPDLVRWQRVDYEAL